MRLENIFTFIIILVMTGCNVKAETFNPEFDVVSPAEFQKRLSGDTSAYLLDVRRSEEFEAGHLRGAHLLNWLDSEEFRRDAEKLDKSKTIYVYCRSGRRSNEAAVYLADRGFHVVDMDGGILAWEENKLPIVSAREDADKMIEAQGIGHDSFKTQVR